MELQRLNTQRPVNRNVVKLYSTGHLCHAGGSLSLSACPVQVAAGGEAAAEAVAAQRGRTRARKRALAEQRRAAVMAAMAAAQAGPSFFFPCPFFCVLWSQQWELQVLEVVYGVGG